MSRRQEINNQIEQIEEHIRLLREQRDRLPEGHISKLRKFLKKRIDDVVTGRKWSYEIVDSFNDNTCGVLLKFYNGTDNSQTIFRSPKLSWLQESIFFDSQYSIIAVYGTPRGLVLEVREN